MQKKNLFITIIVVLILIVLSFVYGYSLKERILSPQETILPAQEESKLTDLEKSKVVQSWIVDATGRITEISDRTLTLTVEEESLVISITEDARIVFLSFPEMPIEFVEGELIEVEEEEINFEDLKVGDEVSVMAKLKPSGELEGTNVSVFQELSEL